jgi:general secretion pathway protein F
MLLLLQAVFPSGNPCNQLFRNKQDLIRTVEYSNLSVLKIKQVNPRKTGDSFLLTFFSGLRDNIQLFHSLTTAINHLTQYVKSPLQQALYQEISVCIHDGKLLSEALSSTYLDIPLYYRSLIQHGEKNGCLFETLSHLIDHLQKKIDRTHKIRKKLIYPCLLMIFTLIFFHFLFWALLPNIKLLYLSVGKPTPNWLNHLSIWKKLLFTVDGLIATFTLGSKIPFIFRLRKKIRKLIDWIPVIKKWGLIPDQIRWLQLFTLACGSQTPLKQAFEQASQNATHEKWRLSCIETLRLISSGESLSHAVGKNRLFPPSWVLAVELGERNHNLSEQCHRLLQQEQLDLLTRIDTLIACIEPILLIGLGGLILGLVLTLYAPLLGLYANYTNYG